MRPIKLRDQWISNKGGDKLKRWYLKLVTLFTKGGRDPCLYLQNCAVMLFFQTSYIRTE